MKWKPFERGNNEQSVNRAMLDGEYSGKILITLTNLEFEVSHGAKKYAP